MNDHDETDGPPTPNRSRGVIVLLLKIVVTAALIAWIVLTVDWSQFGEQLLSLSPWLIVLLLLLRPLVIWLSAVKWQQLLAIHGVEHPIGRLFRWYHISMFFSQFLPSTFGGDGYRVFKTYRNPRGRAAAVLAVFVERVTGLLALLVLGYVGAVIDAVRTGREFSTAVAWVGSLGVVAAIVAALLVWRGGLIRRVEQWPACPAPVRSLFRYGDDYRRHPGRMSVVMLISFLFHTIRVAELWLLVTVLGGETSAAHVAIALTASTLAGILPISFAGWGLIESSFMGVMSLYGVDAATGLAAILVTRMVTLPVTLAGGVVYLFERKSPEQPTGDVRETDSAIPRD